ncbi:amino acid permease [Candidatus Bathyarchaeota archaeon]|nr:amino acid permease [Candidatus Bathyarchaeota archaeon]
MKDPEGDLPYVINCSMTVVIAAFGLLNAALYTCLPMEVMRESTTVSVVSHHLTHRTPPPHQQTNTRQEFATQTLGGWGGVLLSLMVSISAMGALNANTFATAKLAVTASEVGYFPGVLANLHAETSKDEPAYLEGALAWAPWPVGAVVGLFARWTRGLRWRENVPM